MNLTEELMGGLLHSDYEYPNDPSWICQQINDDPVNGQKYIDSQVGSLETYAEKMKFLFGLKVCFEYSIQDLENRLQDELYPVSCCSRDVIEDSEKIIRRYKSALLRVDSAICFEADCNKIPCESQPKSNNTNLTSHQWTLAFHIFFKVLGFNTVNGNQINQVFLTRFLHLVTCEPCPETITNSKYLDYLKNVPEFKRTKSKQTIQDLEVVRLHFERTGFSEAFPVIDAMITKSKSKQ